MEYSTVKYEVDEGVAVLTFNRPHAMNAHNYQMKQEVQAASQEAANDDNVRVLVVTGAGRGFHAGEDVKEVFLGDDFDRLKADRRRNWLGNNEDSWTGQVNPLYFYNFPKPTIAAVNGPAVGAGLSIALSCDIRIAADTAKFGFFYIRRGLMGPIGAVRALINLLGLSRAMELMLSGELIDATEADRIGLVSTVVPGDTLLAAAQEKARKLMLGAPLAQRALKKCVFKHLFEPEGLDEYNTLVEAALAETEDHIEGSKAYSERRLPQWVGR